MSKYISKQIIVHQSTDLIYGLAQDNREDRQDQHAVNMSRRIHLSRVVLPLQFVLDRSIDPIDKSHQKKGKKCSHTRSERTTGSAPSAFKRAVRIPFHKIIGTGNTHNGIDDLLYHLGYRRRDHRFLSLEKSTEHPQKGNDKYRRCKYAERIPNSGIVRINMCLNESGTGKQKDAKHSTGNHRK